MLRVSQALPFMTALAASENAPSVLPAGTTRVRYDGGGKAAGLMMEVGIRAVQGTIERQGAEYEFSAEVRTTALMESPRTAVRGNHRVVPPGVTLGDVRRGWQGPCD